MKAVPFLDIWTCNVEGTSCLPGGCLYLLTLESVKHSTIERLEARALADDYYKCTAMIFMEMSILV